MVADLQPIGRGEGRLVAAGHQAEPRPIGHVGQCDPGSQMAAVDLAARRLVIVVGVTEPRRELEPAVVPVIALVVLVVRRRPVHFREVTVKQPGHAHSQPRDDADDLRIGVQFLEQPVAVLDVVQVCLVGLLTVPEHRRGDLGLVHGEPVSDDLQDACQAVRRDHAAQV